MAVTYTFAPWAGGLCCVGRVGSRDAPTGWQRPPSSEAEAETTVAKQL